MDKQRGGGFTVSGYLALILLALAATEAALIGHLYRNRTIEVHLPVGTTVHGGSSDDKYRIHAWPTDDRSCCDVADTICYTNI